MINEDSQEPEEQYDDVLDERSFKEVLTEESGRVKEQVMRVRRSGWKPVRDLVGNLAESVVDAVQGFADGFEGKKRRGK